MIRMQKENRQRFSENMMSYDIREDIEFDKVEWKPVRY